MRSIAEHRFPLFKWREGIRYLWNPVQKKLLKNRPEERVRLRIIESLLDAGWSRHRISTEENLDLPTRTGSLRTDIICYDTDIKPVLLVECKAPSVSLNEQTALQSARYNKVVGAPYILLTNGNIDFWFNMTGKGIEQIENPPQQFNPPDPFGENDFDYWNHRGFIGKKVKQPARSAILNTVNLIYNNQSARIRYLGFKNSPSEFDLSFYYRIFNLDNYNLAVSFMSTPYGGTRFFAIVSSSGENKGVIEINMDLLFAGENNNGFMYTKDIRKVFDAGKEALFHPDKCNRIDVDKLPERLLQFFFQISKQH